MLTLPRRPLAQKLFRPVGARLFSIYEGQTVQESELIPQEDDWVIEETNFCLGRNCYVRFREEDDLARRALHQMDSQLNKMHTRLRDGTVIPYMSFHPDEMVDRPAPIHTFSEKPLLKWTWDETYEEAYDDPEAPSYKRVPYPGDAQTEAPEEVEEPLKKLKAAKVVVETEPSPPDAETTSSKEKGKTKKGKK
ncbi:conserved hypothetical protein [Perkinsus marinus ATCC 50983]|uniref:Uncharacterized protein n=2 Tax=Perkinsus marinus TaxID=31276 RepID=C5LUI5_PERM5|nr:conserved hypothetical protein [Perkinsus marinus ATCC 50983]EEQ99718.1 conserved hypothetical protein [Perkinsus marinus ATCC 50983]|eukprot:XP_002767001.1 conserved hypothetical protein [Perkinsus marinus ATCC 50983]